MTANLKDICYKKNYLVDVIARIDFLEPAKNLSGQMLPEEIQSAIKSRYEIFEPSIAKTQAVNISNTGVEAKQEEFQQWTYHGSEREKSINLSKKNVNVILKRYENYENFKLDVLNPIKSIHEQDGPDYVARTGVRFINIFSDLIDSYESIKEYFSPMLAGPFETLYNSENCSRNFLVTEYLYGEIKLRMQTGIYNPDYPAKIKKFDFIIDIDAFIDTPHKFSDVEKSISEIHSKIQEHFEASITQKMRDKLNDAQ